MINSLENYHDYQRKNIVIVARQRKFGGDHYRKAEQVSGWLLTSRYLFLSYRNTSSCYNENQLTQLFSWVFSPLWLRFFNNYYCRYYFSSCRNQSRDYHGVSWFLCSMRIACDGLTTLSCLMALTLATTLLVITECGISGIMIVIIVVVILR